MPQQIMQAAGGFQPILTGPADGDDLTAASVNAPIGQLLANQNARRIDSLSDWRALQYPHSGLATSAQRKLVYSGAPRTPATNLACWLALVEDSSVVYCGSTMSGAYPDTMATRTPATGASVRGHSNAGIGCVIADATSGAMVLLGPPGALAIVGTFHAAISGVGAAFSFGYDATDTNVVFATTGALYEFTGIDMNSGGITPTTLSGFVLSDSIVGVAKGRGTYVIATKTEMIEWSGPAGTQHASLSATSIKGVTFDPHYNVFVTWGPTIGVMKSTDGINWVTANPTGLTNVVQFGTDSAGTWIAVTMETIFVDVAARVLVSADGGTTWTMSVLLDDEVGAGDGCNQIEFGDRRFAILGKNRAWFSGRLS